MNILQNLSKIKQINQIELLKSEIDEFRPISKEIEERIFQKFRLDWNYHSNIIEGNSLNYGETIAFLRYGLTAKGKPLKDHLDIRGHDNAISVLMSLIKEKRKLTENDIRELHEIVLEEPYEIDAITADGQKTRKVIKLGQYKTLPNHVKTPTGEIHYYATPEETPAKMKDLMDWFTKTIEDSTIHPLVLAAVFHHKFVSIHPFDDGNGRMARILMNFVLLKKHYPVVVIKQEKRNEYYSALSQADGGNYDEFVIFIAECLIYSLEINLKGVKGESIDEPDDLDKELDLFKKQFKGNDDKIELKRNIDVQKQLFEQTLKPFLLASFKKFEKFRELFVEINYSIVFQKDEQYFYDKKFTKKGEFLNEIFKKISKSQDFERFIIVVRFEDFKSENNPFSIELKFLIDFEKYRYKLSYYFSEIDELKNRLIDEYFIVHYHKFVNNLYHQNFGIDEINNLSAKFGVDLLHLMKEFNKNPDFNFYKDKIVFDDKEINKILNTNSFNIDFNQKKNQIELTFLCDNSIEEIDLNSFVISMRKLSVFKRNFGCKIFYFGNDIEDCMEKLYIKNFQQPKILSIS